MSTFLSLIFRREKWLSFGSREEALNLSPNYLLRNYKFCSQHFTEDEFSVKGPYRRTLKPTALPSVILHGTNPPSSEEDAQPSDKTISLHPTASSNERNVIDLEDLLQNSPQRVQIFQYPGSIFLVSPRTCSKRSYHSITPSKQSRRLEIENVPVAKSEGLVERRNSPAKNHSNSTSSELTEHGRNVCSGENAIDLAESEVEVWPSKRARLSPEPSVNADVNAHSMPPPAEKQNTNFSTPVRFAKTKKSQRHLNFSPSTSATSGAPSQPMCHHQERGNIEQEAADKEPPSGALSQPTCHYPERGNIEQEAANKEPPSGAPSQPTCHHQERGNIEQEAANKEPPLNRDKAATPHAEHHHQKQDNTAQDATNKETPLNRDKGAPASGESYCQLPGNIGWDATDEESPLNRDKDTPTLVTPESGFSTYKGLAESLEETVKKLRKEARIKNQRIRRLLQSKKKKQFKKGMEKLSPPEISNACASLMSGPAHMLFDAQIQQAESPKHQRRWTPELKSLALAIHSHSPKTYRYLRKFLILPCEETLTRFKTCLPVSPGLNESVLASMKKEIATWSDQEKACILILDEMSIKENLYYSAKDDKVKGYVDNGVRRKDKVANEALFAMVKGVTRKWKQAIGFWLTADNEKSDDTILAVNQCLDAMKSIGLTVKILCTDQGSKNRGMASHFGITPEKPYFYHDGCKIFFLWDAPHLIKSIRSNLVTKPFLYNAGEVLWEHIVNTCNSKNPIALRMTHKITQEHLAVGHYRKMKVKLATQILSSSVYVAMLVLIALKKLPPEAEITAEFVNDFDKLYDTFNSMQLNENLLKFCDAITPDSKHIKFLNRMLHKLEGSKFLNCKRQPYCLNGWILNIRSLLLIVEDLKQNFDIGKIRTRLLQTDALENSFAIVRQLNGPAKNPTANELENCFKNIIFSSLPKLSKSTNCENDVEKFIVSIKNLTPAKLLPQKPEPIVITELGATEEEEDVDAPDEVDPETLDGEEVEESSEFSELLKKFDIVEANAIYYVCGYFSFKFLKKHDCSICTKILTVPKEEQASTKAYQTFTYLTARSEVFGGDFGNLSIAPDKVFQTFLKFEEMFKEIYTASCHAPKLSARIYSAFVASQSPFQLCTPAVTENFLRKVIRIRIYWSVRFQNQIIADKKTKSKRNKEKVDILLHK